MAKFALVAFGNEENYSLLFVGGELLRFKQDIKYFDSEMEDVVQQIAEWQPDFVLFSPLTIFFRPAHNICKEIKNILPDVTSVFGGHHATVCPEISEMDGIDVVVMGPARGSVEKILSRETGVIRGSATTPSDLPMPARKEYYRDIPRMAKRYRKFMMSVLGCPWSCSYCSSACSHMQALFGAKVHKNYFLSRRPMDAVIAEAKEITKYETAEIEWADDDMLFSSDIEAWMPEFVSVWKEEIGLPMYVSTTSHNVLRVSDGLLKDMRKIVNCVGLGIQSIRPKSLEIFNRSWDNEKKMKAAYDRLASFGYAVNLQFIVGLPVPDPIEDAMDTIKGVQRIGKGSIASCYPLQIYPGTAIRAYCLENNFKLNEEFSGDTSTGIAGIAFSPQIIKQIRNICKLATIFIKYGIEEDWMRALTGIDFDEQISKQLSLLRYRECMIDRLGEKGRQIFNGVIENMHLRY